EYSTLLIKLGFRQGMSCPNVFYHPERRICCSVHGDDFASSGPADALDWFERAVGENYEITIGPRLGPAPQDAKEGRALNRVIRWRPDGVEYEADPRQAERLIADCGLEGANPVGTPGVRASFKEVENDEALPQRLHTAFRSASARGNYLSADRVDCQFACKEVCRYMASPTTESWKALKRLARFLAGVPRLVYVYRLQEIGALDVYTDTDWAGCPKTRKSTSGGCVMMGSHTVKHWSSTQASVSLSSGEAEFNGVIRGAGHGLGFQALLRDFGVDIPLRVWTDSSAAVGICSRQGLGKLRHLDTHTLWIQQAVRSGRVDLRKVLGSENPADLLTKHSLTKEKLAELVELHNCRYLDGRAESAPQVKKGGSERLTMAQADKDLNELAEDGTAWMPHLSLTTEELDRRFPTLVAPDEELLNDDDHCAQDTVLQHGFTLAKKIAEDMVATGRTRHDPLGRVEDRVDSAAEDPCGQDSSCANGSRARTPPLRTPGQVERAYPFPARQDSCWAGRRCADSAAGDPWAGRACVPVPCEAGPMLGRHQNALRRD
ncbi:MAG TPA: Ty1/Copia family ribonuclease HI, partial [Planctomycetota bacterium]|nr:Ty1/Copia family ribonuclease HI [Planctomycetota bacterium]